MRVMLVAGLVLLALPAAAGSLGAQTAASQRIAPSQDALVAAVHLRPPAGQPVGLERPASAVLTQEARGNQRQGEILMIVGVAGIVTGLLVDEDVITIAGAVVGGYGLYLYLRATH